MKKFAIALLVLGLTLSSCGNEKKESAPVSDEKASSTESVEKTPAADAITINLGSNDQMQYDKNELKAKAGQKVTLVLTHNGQMAKAVMGHNFVLLKQGTDIAEFATEAMAASDSEYIPASDAIIAHTSLIGGGESVSVTFEAPAAGTYDYICSFPGHYGMMKGKFIVE